MDTTLIYNLIALALIGIAIATQIMMKQSERKVAPSLLKGEEAR